MLDTQKIAQVLSMLAPDDAPEGEIVAGGVAPQAKTGMDAAEFVRLLAQFQTPAVTEAPDPLPQIHWKKYLLLIYLELAAIRQYVGAPDADPNWKPPKAVADE